MLYFIAKFALYLFLALFVGVVIGWLVWGGDPFDVTAPNMEGEESPQIQDLAAQVESKDLEIARLRKRLKRVHSDLDARDSHVLAAKTTNDELQGLLAQREDELLALRRTHDGVLEQMAAGGAVITDPQLERRMSELEEDLAASRAEALRLGQQLESVSAGSAGVDEATFHRAVEEAAQQAGAEALSRLAQIEEQLASVTAERQTLAGDLAQAHADLDEAAHRIIEQEQQLAGSATSAAGDPSPELSRIQAELARAKQSVSTWRQRLEEVEDENNRLAGDLAASQSELATVQSELATAQAEVGERAGATNGLSAENERLGAQLAALQAELATLRDELAARHDELEQAHSSAAANEDLRTENERLSGELNRLRNGIIGLDERAAKAEAESMRLQHELAAAQSEGSAQLSALHVELSDARLRADAAHEALQELTSEFISFRDLTMRQQTTVQSLSDRLDRARSTLVGRRPLVAEADEEAPESDDLMRLPGISRLLVAHLRELGVNGYEEIGSWSEADVDRYNTMLEANGVITANDWPGAARRLWEETNHVGWQDRVQSGRQ